MYSRLATVLAAHTPMRWPAIPGRTNHLEAGVLVPVSGQDAPVVHAIVRASGLSRHANEVAFPGGKPEPGDEDIAATAVREAREELGFREVAVLGRLSSWPLYTSDFRLEPFIAQVSAEDLAPDPGEVAEVLHFDVREWLGRPAWEGVPYEMFGQTWISPVFECDGHVMYGATAHVFHEAMGLLAQALGCDVPELTGRRFGPDDILAMARRNA